MGDPTCLILIFAISLTPPQLRRRPERRLRKPRHDGADRRLSCRDVEPPTLDWSAHRVPKRSRESCCMGLMCRLTWSPRPPRQGSRKQHASGRLQRSEEHTSELQSLMRISYAVFCLKKK